MQSTGIQSVNGWWSSSKGEVGAALINTVEALIEEQSDRRDLCEKQLASYCGFIPGEEEDQFFDFEQALLSGVYPDPSPSNHLARIVNTTCAKVFAKSRPKAQITTAGADYRTRLTAKQQSKFLLANMYQRQAGYCDVWDLMEQTGRDSLIWPAGVIKVYADLNHGKICHERVYPFDLYVDYLDAEYGDPKNLFHTYRYDKHTLAAYYPKHAKAIMAANSYSTYRANTRHREDQVCVFEGWRKPLGRDKPGRHVIAVGGSGKEAAVLVDEPWTRGFPMAFIRFLRSQVGFWGMSMIDSARMAQHLYDAHEDALHKNVEALRGGAVLMEENSCKSEAVLSTIGLKLIEYSSGTHPPQVQMASPFNPAQFQWLERLRSNIYELTGVSELTAQGRKEAGVEAAVAIRTINDLQSELFLPLSRNYERLVVDLAKLALEAANDLVDNDVDISLALPNEGFLSRIDWREIRMPDDQYEVTIQPASSLEDTIAGRKQRIVEWGQTQMISPETMNRLLDSPTVDVEHFNAVQRAQYNYLERVISRFQKYDPENDDYQNIVVTPDELMDLDLAIVQMTEAYWTMMEIEAPEENLRLVRDFIEAADKLIQERQAPEQPQAGPPGAPPGPPQPGMGSPPAPAGPPPQMMAV